MKLVPSIAIVTVIAAIPLAGLSTFAAFSSGAAALEAERFIRDQQSSSYYAERVATAILDCRRYEQGLLLAGPDRQSRDVHLLGFLWYCLVLQDRLQAYLDYGGDDTCLEDQCSAIEDYRDAVIRVAARMYVDNGADAVLREDRDLEPFKEQMRAATNCASVAARDHSRVAEAEVSRLAESLRRDQAIASVGGGVSFAMLVAGILTFTVPTARRARRLAEIARRLSDGRRDIDCRIDGDDELAQAGEALERMRSLVAEREAWLVRREAEARKLSEAIERSDLPTLITDATGLILWGNRAAGALSTEDVTGIALDRALRAAGYGEESIGQVMKAIAEGQAFSGERRIEPAGGELSWHRLEGFPVRGELGTPTSFVVLEHDVSDARRIGASRAAYVEMVGLLVGDRPLRDALDAFVRRLESTMPGVLTSVLVLEGDRLSVASAPSLPASFSRLVDGLQIGPDAGSCGRCAYTGEPVIAADTSTHPAWSRYRGVTQAYGFAACWSIPVRSGAGELLGTFAAYARVAREPTEAEMASLRIGAGFAALALDRRRNDARAEQARLQLAEALAEVDRLRRDLAAANESRRRELQSAMGNVGVVLGQLRPAGASAGSVGDELKALIEDASEERPAEVEARTWAPPLGIVRAAIAASGDAGASEFRIAPAPDLPDIVLLHADRARRILAHVLLLVADGVQRRRPGPMRGEPLVIAAECRGGSSPDGATRLLIQVRAPSAPLVPLAESVDGPPDCELARRAAQRIGGNVSSRVEGRDLVVSIELPCDVVRAAPAPPPDVRPRQDSSERLDCRILLVDDHAEIRALFAHHLRQAGATVEECDTGIAALERMVPRDGPPRHDVVLLDMQLPGHDGYAVTRIARAAGCRLPIVAVTAHAIGDERSRCLAAGCDDFATKPLSRVEIIDIARRHARRTAGV